MDDEIVSFAHRSTCGFWIGKNLISYNRGKIQKEKTLYVFKNSSLKPAKKSSFFNLKIPNLTGWLKEAHSESVTHSGVLRIMTPFQDVCHSV